MKRFRLASVTAAIPASLALVFVLVAPALRAQAAPTAFGERKARRLLATRLPCLGCHEFGGEGGRIGPSLTTVGTRRSAAYIRDMIDDPQRVVPGSAMPRTSMPASTRELVTALLARGATGSDVRSVPVASATSVGSAAAVSSEAAALYGKWCAACHGTTGSGDGPNAAYMPVRPRAHSDAARMKERSDDALYDTVAGGGDVMGMSPRMPSFGATLRPEEIRALVRHMRSLCNCTGPAWSRAK